LGYAQAEAGDEGAGAKVFCFFFSKKKAFLASARHSPFILPISAKSWKFIIDGTRILVARSVSDALNSGRPASF
jgi:hypothetical protein